MDLSLRQRSKRTFVAGVVLVAFAARALIPPGFMPAGDHPFSFEICWEGSPAAMPAHSGAAHASSADMGSMDMGSMDMGSPGTHPHHHPGSPAHSEHCVFGTACGAGPVPYLAQPGDLSPASALRAASFDSIRVTVHLVHLPQARAPPGRLS